MKIRIGIDFDNTIVNYEHVFYQAARMQNLIPDHVGTSKSEVRDHLRSIDCEKDWTKLQGLIYGTQMHLAIPFAGLQDFFSLCPVPTVIISHKTLHPFLGEKYNLHEAAINWLHTQSLQHIPVFFEQTLEHKLSRIAEQQCTHFIDDLPEVLQEKNFPTHVEKILFDPNNIYGNDLADQRFTSWNECLNYILFLSANKGFENSGKPSF